MCALQLSEISLDSEQFKRLRQIAKGKAFSADKIRNDKYSALEYYQLVCFQGNRFVITEKGKSYLRSSRKDDLRFWIPTVISLLALIVAVIALFT